MIGSVYGTLLKTIIRRQLHLTAKCGQEKRVNEGPTQTTVIQK